METRVVRMGTVLGMVDTSGNTIKEVYSDSPIVEALLREAFSTSITVLNGFYNKDQIANITEKTTLTEGSIGYVDAVLYERVRDKQGMELVD